MAQFHLLFKPWHANGGEPNRSKADLSRSAAASNSEGLRRLPVLAWKGTSAPTSCAGCRDACEFSFAARHGPTRVQREAYSHSSSVRGQGELSFSGGVLPSYYPFSFGCQETQHTGQGPPQVASVGHSDGQHAGRVVCATSEADVSFSFSGTKSQASPKHNSTRYLIPSLSDTNETEFSFGVGAAMPNLSTISPRTGTMLEEDASSSGACPRFSAPTAPSGCRKPVAPTTTRNSRSAA